MSGRLFSQSLADTRKAPTSGSSSRNSPYSRDGPRRGGGGPESGPWKHDKYDELHRASPHPPSRALQVEHLHYEVTPAELKELFERIGPLKRDPKIMYDRSGRSTGTAYVTYERQAHAQEARTEYDGAKAKGQTISIVFVPERAPAAGPGGGDSFAAGGAASRGAHGGAGRAGKGLALADRINKGDLLSRLSDSKSARSSSAATAGASAREKHKRSVDERVDGGGGRVRGSHGGRGGGGGIARGKFAEKSLADLDAELEAFMKAPSSSAAGGGFSSAPAASSTAAAAAPAVAATTATPNTAEGAGTGMHKAANAEAAASIHAPRNQDGDVEMEG
ncbi:RNA-binding domain-containing protein [Tilletiaria anomala UBC 951]|uniref:RNA-binding domain-containing protein n=1 Tax=Tilletiaria anomala (strain ATCC 24038 / CBS 436.72 / UBC 951) TaxID=1037660 RepID=A0A066VQE6_TILAU|nr:RNA-binding domain-containing protein [Tilletiaria anomala UBC 951]KDN43952.1 RNA-binding domain-containing protein [Tilletiaria anomala UBC 951]